MSQRSWQSILAGILVDVSSSMKTNFQDDIDSTDPKNISRAQSIFKTIISIAEREMYSEQKQEMFALAFGLVNMDTCDLLYLLEKIKPLRPPGQKLSHEPLIDLLKRNGAPHAGEYICKHLSLEEATFLYDYYKENTVDLKQIVQDLPAACKEGYLGAASRFGSKFLFADLEKEKTREQAKKAIENARNKIKITKDNFINELKRSSNTVPKNKTFKSTIDLLYKVTGTSHGAKTISTTQLSDLVKTIEPYIYGSTPMCEALTLALEKFSYSNRDNKVLFLLTDGEANSSPVHFAQPLHDKGVTVFTCLITDEDIPDARRLYYEIDPDWPNAQKDMFELSSSVSNSHSALSVLLERGWKLPPEGESRLFVQTNNAEVIDEFTKLVRSMAESNEALLNIWGRISLDQYIKQQISDFKPKDQGNEKTCYAHAVGTVIHLTLKLIDGRHVPEFEELKQELMTKFQKENGANTARVLKEFAPTYDLECEEVDELGAREAINARRPVVATFRLTNKQWATFSKFYKQNRKGILKNDDLKIENPSKSETIGHAVVLTSVDPAGLTFMNSTGDKWGDRGFFKVHNQSVLNLRFFDVYWILSKLSQEEKKAFYERKRKMGENFVRELPEGLTNLPYKCPKCSKESKAIEFVGFGGFPIDLLKAKCPIATCGYIFQPTPLGFVHDW